MKTLNLEVKLLEKPAEIKNIKKGDIVPITIGLGIGKPLSYSGLALCLNSGKSLEIGFLELDFRNNSPFVAHYIEKNTLFAFRYITEIKEQRHAVIEADRNHPNYNDYLQLLMEVLNKAK